MTSTASPASLPRTVKAARVHRFGLPEAIVIEDVELPEPTWSLAIAKPAACARADM